MKRTTRVLIIAAVALIVTLSLGSAVFADSTPLEIDNKTNMFKVFSASLENEAGQETLIVALNADGYHELYKGTYEQAVANGDGTADKGNDTWCHGYTNTDGKWEFKIPLNDGESYLPIISVSDTYYQKYLKGQNKVERSFYARQITLDRANKKITTDDYSETAKFTIISNVADVKVKDQASTAVVGGPNNNNYSVSPTLVMTDSTYDKITYPTVVSEAVGTASASIKSSKFAISITNAPNLEAFRDKEPIEMTFHVSSKAGYKEAGKDVKRTVTIDKSAKTITIDGEALTAKKTATISILKKSNVKTIKAGGKALKKAKSFTVKTKASSGAKTTYKKTTKGKISVSTAGKVTLKKGLKKGKYSVKVKVSAATTTDYLAASKTITIKVTVK